MSESSFKKKKSKRSLAEDFALCFESALEASAPAGTLPLADGPFHLACCCSPLLCKGPAILSERKALAFGPLWGAAALEPPSGSQRRHRPLQGQ